MIRAVLFDFDMTLIDSSDALLSNINKMAEHFGRPSCTRALLLECIGLNSDAFWEAIFSGFSDEHEAYYVSECLPHEHEKMRAFDGSFECVRALKAAGIKVGCASNRNTPVRVLSMTGLAPLMDCIVGACDVEHPKPAPDVILRGMELLGSAPQETAYIGDTPIDAEAARRAGVHFIAVPTSNTEETLRAAGAKTICPSLRDLPGMILGGERKAAEQ